jgi:hypothetical protein
MFDIYTVFMGDSVKLQIYTNTVLRHGICIQKRKGFGFFCKQNPLRGIFLGVK